MKLKDYSACFFQVSRKGIWVPLNLMPFAFEISRRLIRLARLRRCLPHHAVTPGPLKPQQKALLLKKNALWILSEAR